MSLAYEVGNKGWLVTDKFSKRTLGLLKFEFVGTKFVPCC